MSEAGPREARMKNPPATSGSLNPKKSKPVQPNPLRCQVLPQADGTRTPDSERGRGLGRVEGKIQGSGFAMSTPAARLKAVSISATKKIPDSAFPTAFFPHCRSTNKLMSSSLRTEYMPSSPLACSIHHYGSCHQVHKRDDMYHACRGDERPNARHRSNCRGQATRCRMNATLVQPCGGVPG